MFLWLTLFCKGIFSLNISEGDEERGEKSCAGLESGGWSCPQPGTLNPNPVNAYDFSIQNIESLALGVKKNRLFSTMPLAATKTAGVF
jgi:hypothetical protein